MFSIKVKYIVLILVAKEIIWLSLILIKLNFFDFDNQYAQIRIGKSNLYTKTTRKDVNISQKRYLELKNNQKELEDNQRLLIELKNNNKGLISLAYNLVFYFKTKYINI